jgi:hypothetical protein
MSDWKRLRSFYDAFENEIESLDARYKGRWQEMFSELGCSPSDVQWKDPELKVTLTGYYVSRFERKACTLGLVASIHATLPLVTALAPGAGELTAPG